MNGQLYTAASGLLVENRRLELISNNLANLGTAGFRAQRSFTAEYRGVLDAEVQSFTRITPGAAIAGAYDVAGPGPIRITGNALDVALRADQFFEVETASGRAFTRAGELQVTENGELADSLGRPLLDSGGSPISGLGAGVSINGEGKVFDGASEAGRLRVVEDTERVLIHEGNNLYRLPEGQAELQSVDEPQLRVAAVEGSTTNALEELVQLIEAQRAFESYQKLISLTMNEVNRRAINDITG